MIIDLIADHADSADHAAATSAPGVGEHTELVRAWLSGAAPTSGRRPSPP